MNKLEFESSIPARDGTRCFGCGQIYEIMLLVPPQSKGGNRRRFARHYRCDCCNKVFPKYDFSFLIQALLIYVFGGFASSMIKAMRPSGRHRQRNSQPACELLVVESAPLTKWVKKTQFRSRQFAHQKPVNHWGVAVKRDFLRVKKLMPIHVA